MFTVYKAEHTQNYLRVNHWDFPSGPVVKTLPSNAGGAGSIPCQGAKTPDTSRPRSQYIKQKQYVDKYS